MSKSFVCFILFIGLLVTRTANAQAEFKVSLQAGIPVGEIENSSNLKAGVDLAYLWSFFDVIEVGGLTGYSHFFVQNGIDLPYYNSSESIDIKFIPLALSGRIFLHNNFFMGADAGYAFSLSDWTNGGIYYRPKLGVTFYNMAILVSYEGINMDEGTISSANIGVEFQI